LPEPARRPSDPHAPRPLPRSVAHVAVVGLLAVTTVAGFLAQHPQEGKQIGLSFDLVGTARGAGTTTSLLAAHYELAADPTNPDHLVLRQMTFTPPPTPKPTPKPTATPAKHVAAPVVVAVVGNGSLLWPVPGGVITQYFSAAHLALDIANPAGSPVVAANAGTVISAGWRTNGGGYVIEIDHGNGMHTLYNHLGVMLVRVGAVVGRGTRIASVGCTGSCTGPHVHFQVTVGGVFVNPLRYL
jgi:murein DD-endopeptidase MepM/ murein hydrolase activator NlpD